MQGRRGRREAINADRRGCDKLIDSSSIRCIHFGSERVFVEKEDRKKVRLEIPLLFVRASANAAMVSGAWSHPRKVRDH